MKEILLTQGKVALVDDEDYEILNTVKWYANKIGNTYYATRSCIDGSDLMHRIIMDTPKGMDTDHIDGNGLNNQKLNLRVVTHRTNTQNRRDKSTCSSKYPGVWYTKPWRANININGKIITIGYFLTEKEAYQAYLAAILETHDSTSKKEVLNV